MNCINQREINTDVERKVNNLRSEVNMRIKEIDGINSVLFKKICLFALTEQFAQDANKGKNNSEKFSSFIEIFSGEVYLSNIDPITFSYQYKSELSELGVFDEYLTKICYICDSPVYYDEGVVSNYSEIICNKILDKHKNNKSELEKVKKNIKRHRYSSLIYKYRSKLSHELYSPSAEWSDEQTYCKPFYSTVSSISDEITVRWELRFPYNFLKRIFIQSIHSYLDSCVSNKKIPFKNGKQYLSWYEQN